jgi:hypothetical protein
MRVDVGFAGSDARRAAALVDRGDVLAGAGRAEQHRSELVRRGDPDIHFGSPVRHDRSPSAPVQDVVEFIQPAHRVDDDCRIGCGADQHQAGDERFAATDVARRGEDVERVRACHRDHQRVEQLPRAAQRNGRFRVVLAEARAQPGIHRVAQDRGDPAVVQRHGEIGTRENPKLAHQGHCFGCGKHSRLEKTAYQAGEACAGGTEPRGTPVARFTDRTREVGIQFRRDLAQPDLLDRCSGVNRVHAADHDGSPAKGDG